MFLYTTDLHWVFGIKRRETGSEDNFTPIPLLGASYILIKPWTENGTKKITKVSLVHKKKKFKYRYKRKKETREEKTGRPSLVG